MKILLKKPFILFEIENFLDDQTYESLDKTFPQFNFKDLNNENDGKFSFNNYSNKFKKINEIKLNKIFFKNVLSKKFQKFFFLKFFIYYLRNRPSVFIKKILPNFFYPTVVTTIQYSYILNEGFIDPHIDGSKKLLSLMLYFPKFNSKEEEKLGTIFFKSNFIGNNSERLVIGKFNEFQKIKLPFKKKNLYGFIRNPYSWHAVEKFKIHKEYIRRSINININIK